MARWLSIINSITFRAAQILKECIEKASEGLIEAGYSKSPSAYYVREKNGVKVTILSIRVNKNMLKVNWDEEMKIHELYLNSIRRLIDKRLIFVVNGKNIEEKINEVSWKERFIDTDGYFEVSENISSIVAELPKYSEIMKSVGKL